MKPIVATARSSASARAIEQDWDHGDIALKRRPDLDAHEVVGSSGADFHHHHPHWTGWLNHRNHLVGACEQRGRHVEVGAFAAFRLMTSWRHQGNCIKTIYEERNLVRCPLSEPGRVEMKLPEVVGRHRDWPLKRDRKYPWATRI